MVRRYDEPIQVRTAAAGGPGDLGGSGGPGGSDEPGDPVAFIWRDRLYVVREVLTRWSERRVWWREAAATALLGLGERDRAESPGPVVSTATVLAGERTVWRVEAAAGRCSPPGVYDLVHDPAHDPAHGAVHDPAHSAARGSGGGGGGWRLVRLAD